MKLAYRLSKKPRSITERIIVYEVMARLHVGSIDQYAKTSVFVPQSFTDKNGNKKITWENGIVIPKISYSDGQAIKLKQMLTEAKQRLSEIETIVSNAYDQLQMEKRTPPKGWLQCVIDGKEVKTDKRQTMLEVFNYYIHSGNLRISQGTYKHYKSVLHIIERYETAKGITLYLDDITPDTLRDLASFIKDEGARSDNYISSLFRKLRAFIRWANGLSKQWTIEPLTNNNPFDRYSIVTEQYGTPFYLTIEERNTLAAAELPPRLAIQRDIFVFQCLIGCRVSDLWAMTNASIINDAVEYIPRKTKEGRPITVRVPLNKQAKALVDKYKDNGDTRLFPFTAQQQYNEDIKEMLTLAGITRLVTILDPTTRQEVKRPINEVASSHMARRTFIGNLYKKVKDPNLVVKLSGHKENSRAFARYRDIDDDMAKELVDMLE
jgi:integrase